MAFLGFVLFISSWVCYLKGKGGNDVINFKNKKKDYIKNQTRLCNKCLLLSVCSNKLSNAKKGIRS